MKRLKPNLFFEHKLAERQNSNNRDKNGKRGTDQTNNDSEKPFCPDCQ
jgi:hypothetical protein